MRCAGSPASGVGWRRTQRLRRRSELSGLRLFGHRWIHRLGAWLEQNPNGEAQDEDGESGAQKDEPALAAGGGPSPNGDEGDQAEKASCGPPGKDDHAGLSVIRRRKGKEGASRDEQKSNRRAVNGDGILRSVQLVGH